MAYRRGHTTLILVVCLITVGGAWWYTHGSPFSGGKYDASTASALSTEVAESPMATSSDSDWKKMFLEGSSSNSFSVAKASYGTAGASSDQSLSATDALGREFFSDYMQLRQAGLTNNPAAVQSMASRLASDAVSNASAPKIYSMADIDMVHGASQFDLENYAAAITGILASRIPDAEHNEAVVADQALSDGDASFLSKIDPIISGYEAALNSLLSMRVPDQLARYHVDLLNGVSTALFNAKALRQSGSDPVTAMAAVNLETNALQDLSDGVSGMRNYYQSLGLPFNG